jgi:hypothetical protein
VRTGRTRRLRVNYLGSPDLSSASRFVRVAATT